MEVKEAARTAKDYLTDLFQDEGIMDVGLEEVEFNAALSVWSITIGFSRPWDRKSDLHSALDGGRPARSYKVIRVRDEDGRIESLKDRVLPASDN